MRVFFLLLPVVISLLLMAAHLLRANVVPLMLCYLLLPFSLLIRKPFIAWIVQGTLFLATLEWMRTAFVLISSRAEEGMPWLRLAIIMGLVIAFTLASGMAFFSRTLKKRYGRE